MRSERKAGNPPIQLVVVEHLHLPGVAVSTGRGGKSWREEENPN